MKKRLHTRTIEQCLMRTEIRTTFRACNLCEAVCGLTIEHDDHQVYSIKGDPDDPLSRGYLCPKATALQDIHTDPDRLRRPMRKKSDGEFEEISWKTAFDLVETRIREIQEKHGDDAVATYYGNPYVHAFGMPYFATLFSEAINTRNRFSASSVDQLPSHVTASFMYGHSLLLSVPDIEHTQHMLILGANPVASNGGMITAPNIKARIRAIRERGGKVVLIDPRATETSKFTDEHYFIRPGTDAFLLAAMLNVIFGESLSRLDRYGGYVKNVNVLRRSVQEFSPEAVEEKTGIAAETIRRLAQEVAVAECAVVYGRIGVSTQLQGALCQWLINCLNLVCGNLDRRGGTMFSTPAVTLVGRGGTQDEYARWHSRVRGLPESGGELPVAVMAEEMLTPGDGQIRALITYAGNPVLSTPNGQQVDKALSGLDFFVALDIYINETTRHADLILPSAMGLESDLYDLAFNALAVRNVAKFSQRVFQPREDAMYDWQIAKELTIRLTRKPVGKFAAVRHRIKLGLLKWLTPQRALNLQLSAGPYGVWRKLYFGGLNLTRLKKHVHGVDLGELQPRFPALLRTKDRKIDAAPVLFVQQLHAIASQRQESFHGQENGMSFMLVGRRHLRSNNSWMHNSRRLVKGPDRCTLLMHPLDAESLGVSTGQSVTVSSRVGSIVVPLETTESMMRGVVSLPHGYGHGRPNVKLSVAAEFAGESINDLTDDLQTEPLTGTAAFSGQRVNITACVDT